MDTVYSESRKRSIGVIPALLIALLCCGPLQAAEDQLDIALTLADILRSSRTEIASHQTHINNPDIGDKGLTGKVIVDNLLKRLSDSGKFELSSIDSSDLAKQLVNAQLESIQEIIDDNQPLINKQGVGFKGFVPAVFAQLVNERFGEKVGSLANIKVTAPLHLVRNRKARPDSWEGQVIEDKFSVPSWEKGELFADTTQVSGNPAFRVMVPEYYGDSCLSCHGSPKGELDVTGYPKEGGVLGELGGAISISLFD